MEGLLYTIVWLMVGGITMAIIAAKFRWFSNGGPFYDNVPPWFFCFVGAAAWPLVWMGGVAIMPALFIYKRLSK